MSECVVRMEMPKDGVCDGCGARTVDSLAGPICSIKKKFLGSSRPSWCPIICPLPEGHGRLVDAELVKEILKPVDSISHYEPEWTWGELYESNCVAIDNAPTIVPAKAEMSE